MIGKKLSSPWTSVESELARATSWPVGIRSRLSKSSDLQVVVHVVAQVVLDLERDPTTAVAADVGEAEAGRGEPDEQEQPRPQRRGAAEDDAVDDLARDQRDRRLAHAAEHRGTDREHDVAAVPEHVAPEAPDPPGLDGELRSTAFVDRSWILSQTDGRGQRSASGLARPPRYPAAVDTDGPTRRRIASSIRTASSGLSLKVTRYMPDFIHPRLDANHPEAGVLERGQHACDATMALLRRLHDVAVPDVDREHCSSPIAVGSRSHHGHGILSTP